MNVFLLYFDLYAYMGPVIWFNKIIFYSIHNVLKIILFWSIIYGFFLHVPILLATYCSFTCIHIFSIFWVPISGSHFTGTLLIMRFNKNNNLRRPFENCEFTPLFYRITHTTVFKKNICTLPTPLPYINTSPPCGRYWKFISFIGLACMCE